MAALPQELMEDILSRLPVKSLLRLKTVSKTWYSFISQNHEFANFNLKQSSASSDLFCFQIHGKEYIFQYSDVDNNESRKIQFSDEIFMACRVIGSANGLICVASSFQWDWGYIWNPLTGECKRISLPFPEVSLVGFGYDSISDDYKIIGVWDSGSRVFSLKANSWRRFEFECSLKHFQPITGFHSNGALHWCVGSQIAAFDLAKEKILFLDLPEGSNFVRSYGFSVPLFEYQGSLCASRGRSIWVMKEYGNSKSWAKLTTTSLPGQYTKPVCISRVGEVVFRRMDELGFVKSDIQGRISDEDRSWLNEYEDTFEYKESLISPKCFDSIR